MIFGETKRNGVVHGVIHRSRPFGVGRTYYARTACGKVATLTVGTTESTRPVTGDEPDAVTCRRCRQSLSRALPELFPAG